MLKDLAERTGVTPSLISQVERGLATPSLHTLRALADALEVPVVTFFQEPSNQEGVVMRAADRPRLSLPSSEAVYEILSPRDSDKLLMAEVRLRPGQSTSARPFAHNADEVTVVLKGTVKFEWGDQVFRLRTGDSILIPRGVPHRMTNIGSVEARVIFSMTPPSF
ncbi:MAG: helix-turn-helix transcriptional regulator [Clostridia bacterium]|nr:helix-turn-helix transcriptional regulator [Clostridia bacterium]